MRNMKYKKVTVTEVVCTELKCDICGKDIPWHEKFYHASMGHTDWGNDSVDSIEDFDLCSDECLYEFLGKDWKALKEARSTAYISIDSEVSLVEDET
jgi:predicted nucleic acid-binding Zn ribbon protein